jgi:hypothetical protein
MNSSHSVRHFVARSNASIRPFLVIMEYSIAIMDWEVGSQKVALKWRLPNLAEGGLSNTKCFRELQMSRQADRLVLALTNCVTVSLPFFGK